MSVALQSSFKRTVSWGSWDGLTEFFKRLASWEISPGLFIMGSGYISGSVLVIGLFPACGSDFHSFE